MDNPTAYIVRGGVLESAARPHHPFRQHNKKNALLSFKIINNDFVYHLSLYSTLQIAVERISYFNNVWAGCYQSTLPKTLWKILDHQLTVYTIDFRCSNIRQPDHIYQCAMALRKETINETKTFLQRNDIFL